MKYEEVEFPGQVLSECVQKWPDPFYLSVEELNR